ncbi:MAG TPA: type II toxin-antitoxin system MqsA family antitoxin [Ktedonobacteraceae bacterium]|nr:type II toxin-antitoxin system MqsA family antitoxin [Ktedonobacteraceae bacterium]
MKCITCRIGDTELGTTTVTLEQDATIVVFKNVPADVCQLCGEAYTDEDVTDHLLHILAEEAQKGPKEEFIQYAA